ncbi:hypothetical protein [Sphingomonas arenae]|uniref:hypothetical protein n=1 Tax=Sphingomonas arenae TaxID=2812555 RepID=UPI001966F617|nr:hypothetical protein [Sphingomonas arenae]
MDHRSAAIALSGILLGACAPAPAPAGEQLAGNQAVRCISLNQVAGRSVVDASSVRFEMNGPVDYRNQLQGQCPGLTRLGSSATISVASGGEGGRLCRGDRIRVADPVETRATGFLNEPTCLLGDFVPMERGRAG